MAHRKLVRRFAEFEALWPGASPLGASPLVAGASLLTLFILLVEAGPASAIPAFARREGQACSFCHSNFPKLNATGMEYMSNGFRFPGEAVQNVWDLRGGPPVSVIAEIEAFVNHKDVPGGNDQTDGPDIKVDEIEIMGAGNFSQRVSGFAELEFDDEGSAEVGPTWAQVNDLVGGAGEGKLNLRLGKTVVDLPFLSQHRRVIRNEWLAHQMMDFLEDETGAELNGWLAQERSDDDFLVHRYGGGVARTDRDSSNKLRSGYAYYALEMPHDLHVGTIVKGGLDTQDPDPPAPTDYDGGDSKAIGVLVAGEKVIETGSGPITIDLLYAFQATHYNDLPGNRDNQNFHNAAFELLYSPIPALTFGTRVDWLIETEQPRHHDDGWRFSQLVRWNVIENAWLGAEYRHEEGGRESPVTEDASRTDKGRIFFTLAF